jgi:hypothetical protein
MRLSEHLTTMRYVRLYSCIPMAQLFYALSVPCHAAPPSASATTRRIIPTCVSPSHTLHHPSRSRSSISI